MFRVLLALLLAMLTIESLFLVKCYNQKTRGKLNPVSIMSYLWLLLLNLAFYIGDRFKYYSVDIGCIVSVTAFLNIIIIVAWLTVKPNGGETRESPSFIEMLDAKRIYNVTLILFLLFIISNVFYFRDLGRHIPLRYLYANIWRWKNLVLTGGFNEESILYIGRNISILGTLFAVNLLVSWKHKSHRLISAFICIVYVAIVFLNARRDPMIDKMIYFSAPIIFMYRNRITKLYKYLIPLAVIFVFLFIYISDALTFGQRSMLELAGRYTFAPFNSFQNALDTGYPSNTDLPLGNTFYFIYMILKYIHPVFTPPYIVLTSVGENTGNVYAALIAPLIDSHGNTFLFVIIMIIYAVYIGLLFGVSHNLVAKNNNLSSFVFYSAIFACAIRSFYNPTFSYAEVVGGVINALVVYLFMNKYLASKHIQQEGARWGEQVNG